MKKATQLITATASLLLFLAFIIILWFLFIWHIASITDLKDPVVFEVPPGISTMKLAENLYQNQLINNREYFIWLARLRGEMTDIKTGEYEITPGTSASQLLKTLVKGKVVLRKITLIEGWTFQQLITSLNENPYVTHTLRNKTPEEIMAAIGYAGKNPEGTFYPDTYFFAQGTSDTKILTIAYNLMQEKITDAWETRDPNLPYKTPEEALIMASMVEKEALLHKERPQVAGVMLKRLAIGMRLQIDATVIYGRDADYLKPLTRSDLSTDTPYNTYTRNGLPAGPISMPSESSLQAVFHPNITNDVYYVAKGDGSHTFSENLQGHNQAVGQYRETVKIKSIIANALNKRSTSPELMLKYWQTLNHPQYTAVCLYVL